MRTFGVAAAYPKRAVLQHLQGYIATKLERFSGLGKVLFSRHSGEDIIISTTSATKFRPTIPTARG